MMRRASWLTMLFNLGLVVAASGTLRGGAAPEAPASATTLLEAAKKQAKSSDRAILVVFGASW